MKQRRQQSTLFNTTSVMMTTIPTISTMIARLTKDGDNGEWMPTIPRTKATTPLNKKTTINLEQARLQGMTALMVASNDDGDDCLK